MACLKEKTNLLFRSLMKILDIIFLDEATVGLDHLPAKNSYVRSTVSLASTCSIGSLRHPPRWSRLLKMDHILLLRQGRIGTRTKNDIITPEVLADFYQNPVQIIPIDDHRFYINPS